MVDENKKFTILSIDGGGIRGLIPAKVLANLEIELQRIHPDRKLYEHFDLICGTSTGAILAVGLGLGISAADLVGFYKENAQVIFPKWYLKVIPRSARAFITSIYSNKLLRKKLEEVFTAANNGVVPTLNDLKTKVCIPVFNGNDGKINVLKTRHLEEYRRDYKLPAHEAVLSSASAPVYFPPHTFDFSNAHGSGTNVNMIDGGIFANNPAISFSDIRLLSLGTGEGKHVVKSGWKPKDFWYWFFPKPRLLDIIFDSQSQITEQYMLFLKRIVAKQNNDFGYLRVQYDLGGDTIGLNASDKKELQRLEAIGDELTKNKLNDILKLLKD
jgi:hypothetical protein